MIAKIAKILLIFLNLSIFIILSIIIFRILWSYFGKDYVFGNQTVGSDYFNALTYQVFFAKYFPNPISGWLPFWNEGAPVIGGYPSLSFYLTNPLTQLYDVAVAMNIFSLGSLYLFFIACLLLFWQVSKNWLIAATLTIVAATTQASFYQLTVGGFITSAATQWYLPFTLYFLFKFQETTKLRYLVLSAIFVGFSMLSHGPTGFLLIFLPSVAMLFFMSPSLKSINSKIKHILLFCAISLGIGIPGLYTMIIKTLLGSGSGGCTSPECWGLYPKHLILWLTPVSPLVAAAFISLSLISKIFNKRRSDFSLFLPVLIGFLILFLYSLAAYLKLINGLANVIFPTRTFWAANLFLLLIAASLFASFRKSLGPVVSYFVAALTLLIIILVTLTHPFQIKTGEPNTIPRDISTYITAKEKKPIANLVPDWVLQENPNWRIDIFNTSVSQWFNTISEIPLTGGYSNQSPLAIHQDWQYFLQSATRNVPDEIDQELVLNRALFLIDALGIKFFDNSTTLYPKSITENPKFVKNKDIYIEGTPDLKNIQWYQLSDDITTPIVWPTNISPILFVGDTKGYENFIRIIAMTNLNSRVLIPVRGPKSPNKLTKNELEIFPTIVLYQYTGQDIDKLADYVEEGGKVFIDTGPVKNLKIGKTPEIIPLESLETKNVSGSPDWQKVAPDIVENIDTQKFSDLSYENGPWRITTNDQKLKPWAKEFLSYQNQPVLAGGQIGNGYIIWSGLNLPFHIVDNNNLEEAKLFQNIMTKLITPQKDSTSTFTVERPRPELISIAANNINGIYFKENYDTGWQAQSGEKKLKVYKAGLEFMYVPTTETKDNLNINLKYKGTPTAWLLAFSTIFFLVVSLLYTIFPKLINKVFLRINKLLSLPKHKIEKLIEEE